MISPKGACFVIDDARMSFRKCWLTSSEHHPLSHCENVKTWQTWIDFQFWIGDNLKWRFSNLSKDKTNVEIIQLDIFEPRDVVYLSVVLAHPGQSFQWVSVILFYVWSQFNIVGVSVLDFQTLRTLDRGKWRKRKKQSIKKNTFFHLTRFQLLRLTKYWTVKLINIPKHLQVPVLQFLT